MSIAKHKGLIVEPYNQVFTIPGVKEGQEGATHETGVILFRIREDQFNGKVMRDDLKSEKEAKAYIDWALTPEGQANLAKLAEEVKTIDAQIQELSRRKGEVVRTIAFGYQKK